MHLSILHNDWPLSGPAVQRASAASVTLPWPVVAAHISTREMWGEALRSALADTGARLECIELPALTCLDSATFDRETDDTYMRLQIAERVDAPIAIVASGHEGELGFDMTVDAVTRLAALAERMDVRLTVRNVCGSALEQPDALHELIRRVDSPDLGVCLDALEFAQALVNPAEAVVAFSQRLAAACLPARPVPNLRITESSVRATLAALVEEGFAGPVIVEAREAADFLTQFGEMLD